MTAAADAMLRRIELVPEFRSADRAALLAMAVLTDRDLDSPNGYDVISPDRIAGVLGVKPSTATSTLRGLAIAGHLSVVVKTTVRYTLSGYRAKAAIPPRNLLGFRMLEADFDPTGASS